MEAPNGALFQFEGGFRPGQGQIGKFDWGMLQGDVTIRSDMEEDGPQDDLVIHVNDVQINERRVWSNNDVAFQLGFNHGTGTKLEIRFLPAAEAEGPRQNGLDIGGILSVEITKNVDVTMFVGDADKLFGPRNSKMPQALAPSAPNQSGHTPVHPNALTAEAPEQRVDASRRGDMAPSESRRTPSSDAPVRITCDGSFIFHFERRFAEFDKNVRVTRANPVGPPDLLACQMLDIVFESLDEEAANPVGSPIDARPDAQRTTRSAARQGGDGARDNSIGRAASVNLRPTRLVAFGAPVAVDASSAGASARCERLTYELDNEQVILETITPGHNVSIQWKSADRFIEIESPALSYKLDSIAPRERIGILRSAGPGWLRATDANGGDDLKFTAEWTDRVILQRDQGQPILSLYGSPTIALGKLGRASGNEMHLWLKEPHALPATQTATQTTAQAAAPTNGSHRPIVLPDRMRVLGNVRIRSPQLEASLGDLHVWFRHVEGDATRNHPSADPTEPTNNRLKDLVSGNRNDRDPVYDIRAGLLQLDLSVSGMTKMGGQATAEAKHIWATGGLCCNNGESSRAPKCHSTFGGIDCESKTQTHPTRSLSCSAKPIPAVRQPWLRLRLKVPRSGDA